MTARRHAAMARAHREQASKLAFLRFGVYEDYDDDDDDDDDMNDIRLSEFTADHVARLFGHLAEYFQIDGGRELEASLLRDDRPLDGRRLWKMLSGGGSARALQRVLEFNGLRDNDAKDLVVELISRISRVDGEPTESWFSDEFGVLVRALGFGRRR